MPDVRRALFFASGSRYLTMVINLASGVVLARLLTPSEFGISILGTSLLGAAEAIRELGSIAYLVQQKDLTREKVRAVFTISLIVTLGMASILVLLSSALARFYGLSELGPYVRILALSYAIAPFAHPIYALLSRDMAFGKLAFVDVTTSFVGASASLGLVISGSGINGIAWAAVLSALTWTFLGLWARRDLSIYRPSLAAWRSVVAFGGYGSMTALLYKVSESLFYLILGGMLDARSVGLCQRALMLAQFPERVVLAGVGTVALPAFSEEVRRLRPLKTAYFSALELVTGVHWPALMLLAILARPLVLLVLGSQWQAAVPLVQIFALTLMFNSPTALNYPLQVAVGAIRRTVPLAFAQTTVSLTVLLAVLTFANSYGLEAVALGTAVTIPFNVALSVLVVRSQVPFAWHEFAASLRRSVVVLASSMSGPLLAILLEPAKSNCSLARIALLLVLFGFGWLAGMRLARHPLLTELHQAACMMIRSVLATVRTRPTMTTATRVSATQRSEP